LAQKARRCFDTVHLRHRKVHNHQIRLLFPDLLPRGAAILGLAGDAHIRLGIDQDSQSIADDGMVIRDKDTQLSGRIRVPRPARVLSPVALQHCGTHSLPPNSRRFPATNRAGMRPLWFRAVILINMLFPESSGFTLLPRICRSVYRKRSAGKQQIAHFGRHPPDSVGGYGCRKEFDATGF
jgi:hypothetical protein